MAVKKLYFYSKVRKIHSVEVENINATSFKKRLKKTRQYFLGFNQLNGRYFGRQEHCSCIALGSAVIVDAGK